MPREAIGWYSFIANASDELHEELITMEKAKATPQMFGLAVRSHPASLLVTARNKLGSGKKITIRIGPSNKFVDTAKVRIHSTDLATNMDLAESLFAKINSGTFREANTRWGGRIRRVPVDFIV